MKNNFIDYKLKAEVMSLNLPKQVNILDRMEYDTYANGVIHKEHDERYFDLLNKHGYKFIREARKINQANYKRVDRLKNRIEKYLNMGVCIFCTLTFRNDVLESTTEETRRRYVRRYLKSISDYYIANIDYGKTTEREHYHALILIDRIEEVWEYGFTWFERVHRTNESKVIAKYISKLCNHAIKESTKRSVYIYSRS